MHDIGTKSLASAYRQALMFDDDIAGVTESDTAHRHATTTLSAVTHLSTDHLAQQQYNLELVC